MYPRVKARNRNDAGRLHAVEVQESEDALMHHPLHFQDTTVVLESPSDGENGEPFGVLFHDIIPPFENHGAVVVPPIAPHVHLYIQHLLNMNEMLRERYREECMRNAYLEQHVEYMRHELYGTPVDTTGESIEIVESAEEVVEIVE